MHTRVQNPETLGGLPAPQRLGERAAAAEGNDEVELNGGRFPPNVPTDSPDDRVD